METSALLAMKGKMSYPCSLSELSEMSDYYGLYTETWFPGWWYQETVWTFKRWVLVEDPLIMSFKEIKVVLMGFWFVLASRLLTKAEA